MNGDGLIEVPVVSDPTADEVVTDPAVKGDRVSDVVALSTSEPPELTATEKVNVLTGGLLYP